MEKTSNRFYSIYEFVELRPHIVSALDVEKLYDILPLDIIMSDGWYIMSNNRAS